MRAVRFSSGFYDETFQIQHLTKKHTSRVSMHKSKQRSKTALDRLTNTSLKIKQVDLLSKNTKTFCEHKQLI